MIETARLKLRSWRDEDRRPFAAMNADPLVMRYFPALLTEAETEALLDRNQAHFERHGFGIWAVEHSATGEFAGFTGLSIPRFEAHLTPCVEIGWRLAARFWNRGFATEAALAALRFGFETLRLREIVSFTTVENRPSRRVMEKIGMVRDPDGDFDHPSIAEGHQQRPHVLYRIHCGADPYMI